MLSCLRIRNLAIIESLEVELAEGLTVITGETGAGKSIVVSALELLLGAKASADKVRTGAEQAEIEALFERDGEELLLRRVIQASGRSRVYINGQLATLAQLQQHAALLADICSQHEHHALTDPRQHLHYLDAFAKLSPQRDAYTQRFQQLAALHRERESLNAAMQADAQQQELWRFQLEELLHADIKPETDASLGDERDRLAHAQDLAAVAAQAETQLYADDDALCARLATITHELQRSARHDAKLDEFAAQLSTVRAQLEDVAMELGSYARQIELDPQRLNEVETRLDQLDRLKRKYHQDLPVLLELSQNLQDKLDAIDSHEERQQDLEARYQKALDDAYAQARALSEARIQAAEQLSEAMTRELRSLGMGNAQVVIAVTCTMNADSPQHDGTELNTTGINQVEFRIAPNQGEEARPLHRIASGGELSRALLAIKRVLTGLGTQSLFVFDEIDTGVGGAIAEVIGHKLKAIATQHQVLCITHAPQIAAHADQHWVVAKEVRAGRTQSHIRALNTQERSNELARMLGGLKISAATRQAAVDMLNEAHPPKRRAKGMKQAAHNN